MRLKPENTLALAVDFQENLMPVIGENERIIKNARILLSGLALLEIPVLVTRQYPKGLGDTVPEIKEVTAAARVLDKTTFSCYQDPAIKEAVDGLGRRNVIICGVESHICDLQTAIDLAGAGFNVVYVADCMGSRKPEDKKYGLERAAREGAFLATYESILFELTGGAGSPVFKGISKLVK